MATDLFTIVANGTTYDGNNITNLYYKDPHNQVGRFEFDGFAFDANDVTNFAPNTIIIIYLNGVNRFEGFVQKIKYNKNKFIYHIEGQAIGGILTTRTTGVPVVYVPKVATVGVDPYEGNTTTNMVCDTLFNKCGFPTTGDSGWTVTGDEGLYIPFYKLEQRAALDHIINLAKISGYDWRVYLGPVE